ncbi:large conductance mechanosensitive channel protein MscL [Robertmurraya mangrovi]
MAIGVIVGTAFVKIVDSFVTDIIMPPIGLVLGKVDFSNLYINLSGGRFQSLTEAKEAGAVTVNYGLFLETIIHFGIVAFATYFTILQVNRMKKVPIESMSSKECPYCLSNIPIRAIKCLNCTMDLHEDKEEQVPLEEMFIPTKINPRKSTTRRTIQINISAK